MSVWKNLWSVIGGLVTIVVALGILNLAGSQFEKVVLAGVVVIYATVARGVAGMAHLVLAQSRSSYGQYIELRGILGRPDATESAAMQAMDESFEESTPKLEQGKFREYVQGIDFWLSVLGNRSASRVAHARELRKQAGPIVSTVPVTFGIATLLHRVGHEFLRELAALIHGENERQSFVVAL